MCQTDTTIEVKDKDLGGVTGFSTEHRCRNWDQLIDWVTNCEVAISPLLRLCAIL